MKGHAPIRVGQVWAVYAGTQDEVRFTVSSLNGSGDPAYPIVLKRMGIPKHIQTSLMRTALGNSGGDQAEAEAHVQKLATMEVNQEERWFDRPDVKLVKANHPKVKQKP